MTHRTLVGKQATEQAGVYPEELCAAIAEKVVATWRRVLSLEWWRFQVEAKSQEVGDLQKSWVKNESDKHAGRAVARTTNRAASVAAKLDMINSDEEPCKKFKTEAYKAEDLEEDRLPKPKGGPSSRDVRQFHNDMCVGGMRNPAKSVRRLNMVKRTGNKIRTLTNSWSPTQRHSKWRRSMASQTTPTMRRL